MPDWQSGFPKNDFGWAARGIFLEEILQHATWRLSFEEFIFNIAAIISHPRTFVQQKFCRFYQKHLGGIFICRHCIKCSLKTWHQSMQYQLLQFIYSEYTSASYDIYDILLGRHKRRKGKLIDFALYYIQTNFMTRVAQSIRHISCEYQMEIMAGTPFQHEGTWKIS